MRFEAAGARAGGVGAFGGAALGAATGRGMLRWGGLEGDDVCFLAATPPPVPQLAWLHSRSRLPFWFMQLGIGQACAVQNGL